MELTKQHIKERIIKKLVRWKKWGGTHTEHILNGLPRHMRGERVVEQVINELVQDQWLLSAIKTGETHYALNPRKVQEIMQFYETYCRNEEEKD